MIYILIAAIILLGAFIVLIALNHFNHQNMRGYEFGGYIKNPLGEVNLYL